MEHVSLMRGPKYCSAESLSDDDDDDDWSSDGSGDNGGGGCRSRFPALFFNEQPGKQVQLLFFSTASLTLLIANNISCVVIDTSDRVCPHVLYSPWYIFVALSLTFFKFIHEIWQSFGHASMNVFGRKALKFKLQVSCVLGWLGDW